MMNIQSLKIDLDTLSDIGEMHERFKSELGFMDGYGANFQAWCDCMSAMRDINSDIVKNKISAGSIFRIHFSGTHFKGNAVHDFISKAVFFENNRSVKSRGLPLLEINFVTDEA